MRDFVLTVARMKNSLSWNVTPRSLAKNVTDVVEECAAPVLCHEDGDFTFLSCVNIPET